MKDYYKLLNLPDSATHQQIEEAFLALSKAYHPDRNPFDPTDGEMFKQIQEAYETLSDPVYKVAYDRQRAEKKKAIPPLLVEKEGVRQRENPQESYWLRSTSDRFMSLPPVFRWIPLAFLGFFLMKLFFLGPSEHSLPSLERGAYYSVLSGREKYAVTKFIGEYSYNGKGIACLILYKGKYDVRPVVVDTSTLVMAEINQSTFENGLSGQFTIMKKSLAAWKPVFIAAGTVTDKEEAGFKTHEATNSCKVME